MKAFGVNHDIVVRLSERSLLSLGAALVGTVQHG